MGTTNKQDAPYADFGRRLMKLRKLAGMNRTEFAKACDIAVSSMQNYETGLRMPQADVLQTMARVLNTTMESIMDPAEIEADRLEAEGGEIVGEALSQRQRARMRRNMKETSEILYAGGLSPVDQQAYILSMQRILLDAMEASAKKYSTSSPFTPERHMEFENARNKLDSLWETAKDIEKSQGSKDDKK